MVLVSCIAKSDHKVIMVQINNLHVSRRLPQASKPTLQETQAHFLPHKLNDDRPLPLLSGFLDLLLGNANHETQGVNLPSSGSSSFSLSIESSSSSISEPELSRESSSSTSSSLPFMPETMSLYEMGFLTCNACSSSLFNLESTPAKEVTFLWRSPLTLTANRLRNPSRAHVIFVR